MSFSFASFKVSYLFFHFLYAIPRCDSFIFFLVDSLSKLCCWIFHPFIKFFLSIYSNTASGWLWWYTRVGVCWRGRSSRSECCLWYIFCLILECQIIIIHSTYQLYSFSFGDPGWIFSVDFLSPAPSNHLYDLRFQSSMQLVCTSTPMRTFFNLDFFPLSPFLQIICLIQLIMIMFPSVNNLIISLL